MTAARVIPLLLLKGQGLVKTKKFRDPVYIGDPVNAIRIFNDKEVDELLLLDISATRERRGPNFKLIEEIASQCFMPLGYGGGIRTMEEIKRILHTGVEKISLNASALHNSKLVTEAATQFGSQAVVVSVDVKAKLFGGYEVYGQSGTKATGIDPIVFCKRMAEAGAGEILLNSVDRDGMAAGYDLGLVRSISDAVDVPLVACGGAGNVEHLREGVKKGHASAVAAGSMFVFHGPHRAVLISYPSQEEVAYISS